MQVPLMLVCPGRCPLALSPETPIAEASTCFETVADGDSSELPSAPGATPRSTLNAAAGIGQSASSRFPSPGRPHLPVSAVGNVHRDGVRTEAAGDGSAYRADDAVAAANR